MDNDVAQPAQRFIARELATPLWQTSGDSDERYQARWELWDTVDEKRAGAYGRQLFADQATCMDYAATWSRAFGPPERCGACGHVFDERESVYGHARYCLLCFRCAAAKEGTR